MAVFRCMVSSVFNVEPNPFHLFISIFIRTDGMSVNDGIHRDCSVYIEVVPLAITLLLCPSYGTYPPFFQKSTKSAVLPIWKTAPII